MRIHADNGMVGIGVLFLLGVVHAIVGTSVTVATTQSTCPARSINYITQTLPQQCLTSSWSSKPTPQTASTNITSEKADASTSALAIDVSPNGSSDLPIASATYSNPSGAESIDPPRNSEHGQGQSRASSEPTGKVGSPIESSPENDLDSPLDNSKFLSFEEWKSQNLAKAGQSAETLGKKQDGSGSEKRMPANINNALDAFGEDSEIEIDFSGFVNAGSMNEALAVPGSSPVSSTVDQAAPEGQVQEMSNTFKRNKEAGKTCKERSNYASFDCAATVLKTNPECKSATSVLVESKDSYMLNVCSADNKFFIVELCDDILVDTVVLANFEYFSSMFRTFRISVSDRYPVKMDRWKELGVFEARNSRAIQAFLIENPLIWARYLRVEFLTHFGAEYYCPVSLLRVHGTTMMEEFNHELKDQRSEEDPEDEAGFKNDASTQVPDLAHIEATSAVVGTSETASPKSTPITTSIEHDRVTQSPEASSANDENCSLSTKGSTSYRPSIAKALEDVLFSRNDHVAPCSDAHQHGGSEPTSSSSSKLPHEIDNSVPTHEKSAGEVEDRKTSKDSQVLTKDAPVPNLDTPSKLPNPPSPSQTHVDRNASSVSSDTINSAVTNGTAASVHPTADIKSVSEAVGSLAISSDDVPISSSIISARPSSEASSTSDVKSSAAESISSTGSSTNPSPSSIPATSPSSISIKIPTSSTQPPPANPSTQESFFKSVHKRLQQLEANSTLSLQYIEEQSRILRDAFSSVEKRQLSKTSTFLETLNTTVLTELRDFRMQYDQIWQSTVLELSSQREQSAQQVSVLSARMAFLADEIVFQKRIAMIQFMLILLCLGLIAFARSGRTATSTYLEIPPVVQNALKKSSANLARYAHFETPPASPSPSRPPSEGLSSKYNLFHRKSHHRTPSDESEVNVGEIQGLSVAYSPPSPVSQNSRDEREASPSSPSADELDTMNFHQRGLSTNDVSP